MDILKNVLLVVYIIVCLVLILITTMQSKDNEKSLDDTYENPRFEKNKSRTRAEKIEKRTIIISVLFGILTVATTLVCYLV